MREPTEVTERCLGYGASWIRLWVLNRKPSWSHRDFFPPKHGSATTALHCGTVTLPVHGDTSRTRRTEEVAVLSDSGV
jgi:hypothetical protein